MKKYLLIIFCLISQIAFAQLETNLVVSANPPGTLIEWATKKETLTYIILNRTGAPRQVLVKAVIRTTDGMVAATTNLSRAKIINIMDGTTILSAAEVIPLETMIFNGKFKSTLDKTGKLPVGTYELCVQLVTPVDFVPVSQERCRVFNVAGFQLPIAVIPNNEAILDLDKAKTTITFRWTPISPRPAEPVIYKVLVFEILENQTPMQALRSNQPLLAQEVFGTTQYIWQHQLSFLPCCNETETNNDDSLSTELINGINAYGFIWTVQAFDALKRPFSDGNINGDGIGEPNAFFIDRRPAIQRKKAPVSKIHYFKKSN
jgi:hypothetical protein